MVIVRKVLLLLLEHEALFIELRLPEYVLYNVMHCSTGCVSQFTTIEATVLVQCTQFTGKSCRHLQ